MDLKKLLQSTSEKITAIIVGLFLYYGILIYPSLILSRYLGFPISDLLLDGTIYVIDIVFIILFSSPILGQYCYKKFKSTNSRKFLAITMTFAGFLFFICLPSLLLRITHAFVNFHDATLYHLSFYLLLIVSTIALLGIINANLLFIKRIRITDKRLKKHSTAVQLSDVHIGSRSHIFISRLIKRVNEINADKVFITGDLVDLSSVDEEDLKILKKITAPVYFVVGNHDRYVSLDRLLPILERQGFTILRNETLVLDDFDLSGIDDAESPKQVEKVLQTMTLNKDKYNILLYHRPQGFSAAISKGVDLMLAGHTHNGQIFPFNLIVKRIFKNIKGSIKRGNAILHVSTGTSTWGPIMRIGSVNEVTLISFSPLSED